MQAPVIIHTGFIMIVFMPTSTWFYLFTQEGNQAPLKLSIRTSILIKIQNCITLFSEMLSETKGKRLGTLRCRGLKPPVARGHAAAFNYRFNAFGHTGPYSQSVKVSTDRSQNVFAKENQMMNMYDFVTSKDYNCSGIARCSVFVGRFLLRAKQRVEQVAQISFTKKLYFMIYFLCCWQWKCKFLNKLKRSLDSWGGIIIFPPTMRQEGKRLRGRQTSARSC